MSSNIMDELTSKSTSVVYNALVTIRTVYIKNIFKMEQLQRAGIVKLLISFMEKPKFCSVSLSIVATCCMQKGFCHEVIEKGGVVSLARILKSLANDEILNRVVRALGNIALTSEGANEIRKHDGIKSLLTFLTNTTDCDCQQSALRTLRILGEDPEQKKKIINLDGILAICNLLTSKNENVLKVCGKTLAFLTDGCCAGCIRQIQKADALPALVNLYYNSYQEVRQHVLIIFEHLAGLAPMVEDLSNHKVLEIFVKVASSSENHVKSIQSAVLSLCLCCKHYRNRKEIRELGGLPILIKISKNRNFVSIQNEILLALVSLCSEINDLDKLRELQLLPACIQLLKNYVKENKKAHDFQRMEETVVEVKGNSRKRKGTYAPCVPEAKVARNATSSGSSNAVFSHSSTYPDLQFFEPSSEAISKVNSEASLNESSVQMVTASEFPSLILSHPESELTTDGDSIAVSGPSKLQKVAKKQRCSGQKSGSNDSCRSQPASDFEWLLDNLALPSSKQHKSIRLEVSKAPVKSIDHCILTLLAHLAHNLERTRNSEMVEERNVGVLLDYVVQLPLPNEKASEILYSLISNRHSFEKLVLCNFIGQLETRIKTPHDTEFCQRCHRLLNIKNKLLLMGRLIAESAFGVGTLIHLIAITDSASQLNCLYAIGKLIQSKKLLLRILFESRGFETLKKYLAPKCKLDFEAAVQCLSMISSSLAGKYEYKSASRTSSVHGSCQFGNHSFDLTILLDDGSKVTASREELSNNCDFFRLMLQGWFSEASQNVVSLPCISKDVLLLILHLLHGCSAENCIYWEHLSADTLLKLLDASERFLLPTIKSVIQERIVGVMGFDNICAVYSAARLYSPVLTPSVLQFLLCSPFSNEVEYSEVVQSIIALDSKEFFKDLETFLKKHF